MKPCANLIASLTAIRAVAETKPTTDTTLVIIQREARAALDAHKDCDCKP